MKIRYYTIIICFFIYLGAINVYAQEAEKTVTLVASGQGKTQEEAKQSALRSAIEQAFGAFISTKTEMLNDQVVSDEMSSVSAGNIQSFDILSESELPNGSWLITLKTKVSISKLTSFVQSKGVKVEIKGGLFAINVKQQILNEEGEFKALFQTIGTLHNLLQNAFDFNIKAGDPTAVQQSNQMWDLPLTVTSKPNENFFTLMDMFTKTLNSLSLSREEAISLTEQKRLVGEVKYIQNGINKSVYLRNINSFYMINRFLQNFEFYQSNFNVVALEALEKIPVKFTGDIRCGDIIGGTIDTGDAVVIPWIEGYDKINIFDQKYSKEYKWSIQIKLSDLEKLESFEVITKGKILELKSSGLEIDNNGKKLICAFLPKEIEEFSELITSGDYQIVDAKSYYSAIADVINKNLFFGFSKWRIPSLKELNLIFKNLQSLGIDFYKANEIYMSSDFRDKYPLVCSSCDDIKDFDISRWTQYFEGQGNERNDYKNFAIILVHD